MHRNTETPPPATRWLYDGWNPVAEFSDQTTGQTLVHTYHWGMDLSGTMQGAGGVGGLLAVHIHDPQSTIYYPSYDGNGNIVAWTASGATAPTCIREYDSFGNILIEHGTPPCEFGFSTKLEDPETGLFYYGHRFLSPLLGRWLSTDPIEEEGGVSLYGFVGNDSVSLTDYLGKAPQRHRTVNGWNIKNEEFSFDRSGTKVKGNTSFEVKTEYDPATGDCVTRVIVYINFRTKIFIPRGGDGGQIGLEDQAGYEELKKREFDKELPGWLEKMNQGISHRWNDLFEICCKKKFNAEGQSIPSSGTSLGRCKECCVVRVEVVNHPGGLAVSLFRNEKDGGAEQRNWNMSDHDGKGDPGGTIGWVAAHEIGHFLGNVDEYGTVNNSPSPGDANNTNPNRTVMGRYDPGARAHPKHFDRVLQALEQSGGHDGCTIRPCVRPKVNP